MAGSDQNELLKLHWQSVLAGDAQSLQSIHTVLYPALMRYASKMLHDEQQGAEAVQDVFIKAWQKCLSIGQVEQVQAFFFTLLRRHCLNMLRSGKKMTLISIVGHQADIVFSPEDIIIHTEKVQERQQLVHQLLESLSKRQKEVLYLRFIEELDYQEIAAIMHINYQSVINLSFRAIQMLRKKMEAKK